MLWLYRCDKRRNVPKLYELLNEAKPPPWYKSFLKYVTPGILYHMSNNNQCGIMFFCAPWERFTAVTGLFGGNILYTHWSTTEDGPVSLTWDITFGKFEKVVVLGLSVCTGSRISKQIFYICYIQSRPVVCGFDFTDFTSANAKLLCRSAGYKLITAVAVCTL